MGILVVAGTRPEAIKLAPVVEAFRTVGLATRVCATGQHRDLLGQAFGSFGIVSDIHMDLSDSRGDLDSCSDAISERVGWAIDSHPPDWVVVQGDTTSALAAARAASERGVPIAHVEAGLRTFDLTAPWPEERNRCAITRLASLHFAPTPRAVANLLDEGIDPTRIAMTGNTVVDALAAMRQRLAADPVLRANARHEVGALPRGKQLIFLTAHRRESHGAGLAQVARAIRRLAARQDVEIVLPVHPNPAVASFKAMLDLVAGVRLVSPLSYPACVILMERSALIITDSGGLQEEAPSLGIPLLITRGQTERPEAIEAGAAILVGTDADRIEAEASRLLDSPVDHAAMAQVRMPFGDGKAAIRIAERIASELEGWRIRCRNKHGISG